MTGAAMCVCDRAGESPAADNAAGRGRSHAGAGGRPETPQAQQQQQQQQQQHQQHQQAEQQQLADVPCLPGPAECHRKNCTLQNLCIAASERNLTVAEAKREVSAVMHYASTM